MEWIETTGSSVDAAKEIALDRLGVAEDELDYEILVEPTSALFGLRRTDARLRARVRPVSLRPKDERRDRGRRRGKKGGSDQPVESKQTKRRSNRSTESPKNPDGQGTTNRKSGKSGHSGSPSSSREQGGRVRDKRPKTSPAKGSSKRDNERSNQRSLEKRNIHGTTRGDQKKGTEAKQMNLETQARTTEDFVRGLLERMGLDARVVSSIEEDRLLVEAQGLNLGLAIGQRGETVRAITQLARTRIQRMSDGDAEGSLVVDIGGYRERRRSFLAEFASNQAEEVLADGRPRALEPMNASDRKVVHDAVADIQGVVTQSEGSDMERHVVIAAEAAV